MYCVVLCYDVLLCVALCFGVSLRCVMYRVVLQCVFFCWSLVVISCDVLLFVVL